jgi:hypothetical protein
MSKRYKPMLLQIEATSGRLLKLFPEEIFSAEAL